MLLPLASPLGSGDLKSDSHIIAASSLPSKPSPQPWQLPFKKTMITYLVIILGCLFTHYLRVFCDPLTRLERFALCTVEKSCAFIFIRLSSKFYASVQFSKLWLKAWVEVKGTLSRTLDWAAQKTASVKTESQLLPKCPWEHEFRWD